MSTVKVNLGPTKVIVAVSVETVINGTSTSAELCTFKIPFDGTEDGPALGKRLLEVFGMLAKYRVPT